MYTATSIKRHTYNSAIGARKKTGEAHVEELLDGDGGSAAAVHGVLSAASDTSACVSCACSMLWTVVSTGTAGLAMGKAGAATTEGRPPELPPSPRRRVSDRETPFCRRRLHPSQQHASKHSNTTPAARLPASQRTPASIQASPSDTLLPSRSPDGGARGGGGGGGGSGGGGGGGGGGGSREGGSEGGGIGGKIGCCTLIVRVSSASFRPAEIVPRT